MPKSNKVSGYLVKIEAFVPADLTDNKAFTDLQSWLERAKSHLPNSTGSITPTRR